MDVWDALKLMARRWYVAVPMVTLTLVGAVLTLIYVKPHHVSEGHIMLLPPSTEILPEQDQVAQSVNPWSTESLMAAVVTRLSNRALEGELAAEGYNATWEADADVRFDSVVTIETRSDSPGDAQATLQRLMTVVEVEVERQQQPYNLPPGAKITTLRLDSGENIELARGNQARALVVVVGIGGILTLVTTVSADVLLRSRERRRATRRYEFPMPAVAGSPGGNGNRLGASMAPSRSSLDDDATRPISPAVGGPSFDGIGSSSARRETSTARDESVPAARDGRLADRVGGDDATMVIPLNRDSWEPEPAARDGSEGRGS